MISYNYVVLSRENIQYTHSLGTAFTNANGNWSSIIFHIIHEDGQCHFTIQGFQGFHLILIQQYNFLFLTGTWQADAIFSHTASIDVYVREPWE